ncbi:hypothetical protein EJ04DRAFT_517285 [Polyplosphaeria fusca]|uniref:Uncharacterized protein n=1 Tax=Polyplosphaeria fusca TaxID=682080 RepID=A0A9P4QHI1_9PLEO|nr:hypothetical protein EJ04DRAFT_517285 [Polyplosphaeria fusca]
MHYRQTQGREAGLPNGKVIVQFDPTHRWEIDEQNCAVQTARIEVWLEARPEPIFLGRVEGEGRSDEGAVANVWVCVECERESGGVSG